jgi:4-hydroxy-tetrahydrodipicolinate synthase
MRKGFEAKGIVVALATPLDEEEGIDEIGLRCLVNHVIAGGIHGILALGSQGEFYGLTANEKRTVLETVIDEVHGRLPVYAGTGSCTTRDTIALTRMAEEIGADVAAVLTPYFLSPSGEELYGHYAAVAAATKLPVLLYTNPARTGVNLTPELVGRLSRIQNVVGIKDSLGDLSQTMEYVRVCGDGFSVLAGKDTLIYATLQCGGQGAISATANVVPDLAVEIYEALLAGDAAKSLAAQRCLAPLRLAFNLGTFPVVVKEALAMMGICSARALAPAGPLAEEKRALLRAVLEGLEIL